MSMDQILGTVRAFEGVFELAPGPGSEFPEIAWGDHFFYYAPDGQVPRNYRPFATIVTKDYPGEPASDLDHEGRYRVNVDIPRSTFLELIGEKPRDVSPRDVTQADVFLPHPVYGTRGWIAVVDPGDRTMGTLVDLLRSAYGEQRRRVDRRRNVG